MASSSGGIGFLVLFGLAALAYANGGCDLSAESSADGDAGDGTFDFSPDDGGTDDADGLATCDGVVVIEAASGSAEVPGDTSLLDTSASTACVMGPEQGDDDAVVVLQNALAQCNGQAVEMDGEYGAQTVRAVATVQRQAGVAEDGKYGPVTLQVMRWPATASEGSSDCVGNVSEVAVAEEATSQLPLTG
jgi:peptidoglycan hydrolase-like protein with peptidoglycan-binding domain